MDPQNSSESADVQVEQDGQTGQAAGGDQGLPPNDGSETGDGAPQDTTTPAAGYTADQVEQMRRDWQSQSDKRIHQERMSMLSQQQRDREQAEQRARIEGMDDEDFGRYTREQQAEQAKLNTYADQQRNQALMSIQRETLDAIADPVVRKEIEDKINNGEYQDWGAFMRDATNLPLERATSAAAAKAARAAAEAATKDAAAAQANSPDPVLGTGSTVQADRTKGLSPQELMRRGYKEMIEKQRRR